MISLKLKQAGTRLSAVTVQDILSKHELGGRRQRLFAAEKRHLAGEIELDEQVIAALERHNPCYRERHTERPHLGYRNMGRCRIETVSSFTRKLSA